MTVSNLTNRTSAVGTGAAQTVPFSFPILVNSDITVIARVTATGVETALSETTHYTVTNNGESGGSITTVTPFVASTSQVHIIRNTPLTQTLDLTQGGSFNAENIEDTFDKSRKLDIENFNSIDRVIKFPDTDPTSAIADLPSSIDRKGKFLSFDSSTGAPTASSATDTSTTTISAFADTYLDDATAALTMDTLQGIPVINVKNSAYGATGDGATDESAAINLAVTAAANKWLVFPPGTYKISANVTIAATVHLVMLKGAIISVDSGKTLTINATSNDGFYQRFSGDGTVTFAIYAVNKCHPEWWGASGDDTDDDSTAVQSAIDSGCSWVEFGGGDFYFTNIGLTTGSLNGLTITGAGRSDGGRGTRWFNNNTTSLFITDGTGSQSFTRIADVSIRQVNNTGGHIFEIVDDIFWFEVERVWCTLNNPAKSFFTMTTAGERPAIFKISNVKILAQPTGGMSVPVFEIDATVNLFNWHFDWVQIDGTTDMSAPAISIESTSGGDDGMNSMSNMLFEVCDGGAIDIRGVSGVVLENITVADSFDGNVTNHLIQLRNATGDVDFSRNVTLINVQATVAGGVGGAFQALVTENTTAVLINCAIPDIDSGFATPAVVIGGLNAHTITWTDAVGFVINKFGSMTGVQGVSSTSTLPTSIDNTVIVDIDSDEIRAIESTPITLVAAPGATKYLEFVSATLILDYGTVTFDDAAGDGNLVIGYVDENGIQASQDIEANAFIDATVDTFTTAIPKKDVISAASVSVNKALVIYNDAAAYTGATADSVIQVIVQYRTHTSLGL